MSLLTVIILVPLLGALGMVFIPNSMRFGARLIAIAVTFVTMLFAFGLWLGYDASLTVDGYKFVQQVPWVQALGISYHVGVDGINLPLIIMGAVVAFAAACASYEIQSRQKEYYILLLLMTGGILGAFASLDLFFFYFFHELALVPTFIMIGVWGYGEKRNYAAFNMTLYLSLGALLALAGLIGVYMQAGSVTTDIVELGRIARLQGTPLQPQTLIFPALMFGFGILVSLWPFHTWAPLGYGAAPAGTAMLHAGVLKKFGLYGLIRIAIPLVPDGARMWLHILAYLALGNLVLCGWVAMRQRDLNQLIGNSSVAHMGFAFLGIASLTVTGVTGAVMVMVAHGFLAALSFALSGYLRFHAETLEMERMGGFLKRLPFVGTAMIMAMMAGCGLPGFGNFAGEMLVMFGSWDPYAVVTVLAAWSALIIGAVYMLRAIRTILHGPMADKWDTLKDADSWRRLPFALLLGCLLAIGIWPRLVTDRAEAAVKDILDQAKATSAQSAKALPRRATGTTPDAATRAR